MQYYLSMNKYEPLWLKVKDEKAKKFKVLYVMDLFYVIVYLMMQKLSYKGNMKKHPILPASYWMKSLLHSSIKEVLKKNCSYLLKLIVAKFSESKLFFFLVFCFSWYSFLGSEIFPSTLHGFHPLTVFSLHLSNSLAPHQQSQLHRSAV